MLVFGSVQDQKLRLKKSFLVFLTAKLDRHKSPYSTEKRTASLPLKNAGTGRQAFRDCIGLVVWLEIWIGNSEIPGIVWGVWVFTWDICNHSNLLILLGQQLCFLKKRQSWFLHYIYIYVYPRCELMNQWIKPSRTKVIRWNKLQTCTYFKNAAVKWYIGINIQ